MIAISYRREDSLPITGRLYDRLQSHFGRKRIFMDFDSIPAGVDFRGHIKKTIEQSELVIAVVGSNWLGGDGERRRIDDANDFVRLEISYALARDIPVLPVLVNDAPMPRPEELPEDIQALAFRNALPLDTGRDFHNHAQRLIGGIRRTITENRRRRLGKSAAALKSVAHTAQNVTAAGRKAATNVASSAGKRLREGTARLGQSSASAAGRAAVAAKSSSRLIGSLAVRLTKEASLAVAVTVPAALLAATLILYVTTKRQPVPSQPARQQHAANSTPAPTSELSASPAAPREASAVAAAKASPVAQAQETPPPNIETLLEVKTIGPSEPVMVGVQAKIEFQIESNAARMPNRLTVDGLDIHGPTFYRSPPASNFQFQDKRSLDASALHFNPAGLWKAEPLWQRPASRSMLTCQYIIIPRRTGSYKIEPQAIHTAGGWVRSAEIKFDVVPAPDMNSLREVETVLGEGQAVVGKVTSLEFRIRDFKAEGPDEIVLDGANVDRAKVEHSMNTKDATHSSLTVYHYNILPNRYGTFIIPSQVIRTSKGLMRSREVRFEVSPTGTAAANVQSSPPQTATPPREMSREGAATQAPIPGREEVEGAAKAESFAISRPRPEYPYELRKNHITGKGICILAIDRSSGIVTGATMSPSTGNAELDKAALEAFRRWRFKPNTVSMAKIPISFTMDGKAEHAIAKRAKEHKRE